MTRPGSNKSFPSGLKVIESDYTAPSLKQAFTGQDVVISAFTPTLIGAQQDIIDAAIAAGVKRFVPAEFGSDTENAKAVARVPMFHAKVNAREYLRSKESAISWTAIVNGLFLDWGLQVGFLGLDLKSNTAQLYQPGHDVRFSATTLEDVGVATAKALLPAKQSLTKNRVIRVRTVTTTQDEILAALEKKTGSKWQTKVVETGPLIQAANEKAQKGDFSGIPQMILGAVLDPECDQDFDAKGELSNDALGLKKKSLEEVIASL